ncbi:MAG: glycosyltransferase family 87 protein [Parvularculaceae bacterium]
MSRLRADKWALFFMASSPAIFQAAITGQNGFLTGALMIAAGAFPDRRPIIAGVAAGLLTVKPQLGLLIPIAFVAAGCWRAFFAAAATAIILAFASSLAFGTESWIGFYEGATAHGARMAAAGFPFNKLVTPFGFVTMLGAPAALAGAVQAAAALLLAAFVFIVWRRVKAADIRYAALAAAAVLATPYAFYYELTVMAPAIMLIAKRGAETGWLKYEKIMLIAVWILPLMMPGPDVAPNLSNCAAGALLAFAMVARRALPEAGIRFASAKRPATAGL